MTHVRSDKARAEDLVTNHPRFQQLDKSFDSLDPVTRAEYVAEICRTGNRLARTLAGALDKDPGTIRRDLRIAKLSAEQKADIRGGHKSVNEVLEAKKHEPQSSRVANKTAELQQEIIGFFDHLDLAPSHVVNILDYVSADKLPRLRKNGKRNGRRRSRMKLRYLVRYTRPKKKLDPSDLKWVPGIGDWLLRWSLGREPENGILEAALVGAREYFRQRPPKLLPYGTPYEVYEGLAREARAENAANSAGGPESMRSPQSKVNPHAAKEEEQRKREAADAADERYVAHMRGLMSGNSSSDKVAANLQPRIRLTTVGEELESERKKAEAKAELRNERIRQEMGWPVPGQEKPSRKPPVA